MQELIDELKYQKFPVLDDGFVCLVDVMGSDAAIAQAARVSYGEGTKSVSDDRTLIRYLMRHRHCYHPDMEVLTAYGWKKWGDCNPTELLLVPDPVTKQYRIEHVAIQEFGGQDKNNSNYVKMHTFKSSRMSYCVSHNHRMWIKPKYRDDYEVVRVQDMTHWGNFEPATGYHVHKNSGELDTQMQFVGFFLGDGSWASSMRVNFHLKKQRKIEYLKTLLSKLKLKYSWSNSKNNTVAFFVETPSFLFGYCKYGEKAKNKSLKSDILTLNGSQLRGLLDGLLSSDGCENESRKRCEFSSTSQDLLSLVEVVATYLGIQTSRRQSGDTIHLLYSGRTTLEARKKYFGREDYEGKVYCATTSTGLLMVRGGENEFAFVCGNSTPFEMAELKFHIRVPLYIWQQWLRHRTASINQQSHRYSVIDGAMQRTEPNAWRLQSKNNKQGSEGTLQEWPERIKTEKYNNERIEVREYIPHMMPIQLENEDATPGCFLTECERRAQNASRAIYETRLKAGIAREQARKDLPLSTYTEAYWKIDLHNLLHFLSLRMAPDAQQEIRDYADAIGNKIVSRLFPATWEAFCDYRTGSVTLTRLECEALKKIASIWPKGVRRETLDVIRRETLDVICNQVGLTNKRERQECREKLERLGLL